MNLSHQEQPANGACAWRIPEFRGLATSLPQTTHTLGALLLPCPRPHMPDWFTQPRDLNVDTFTLLVPDRTEFKKYGAVPGNTGVSTLLLTKQSTSGPRTTSATRPLIPAVATIIGVMGRSTPPFVMSAVQNTTLQTMQ